MLLKKDTFGEIRLDFEDAEQIIVRDVRVAPWWARGLARRLLAREAIALTALDGLPGVPELLYADRDILKRRFIRGQPLYLAPPPDEIFFRDAAKLLRRMHRAGVLHNDLAKEPNLLVDENGKPAFIDFQLASFATRRNLLLRVLGREDIRHLLKHKRTYCSKRLTAREKQILDNPSLISRFTANVFKPIYLFVTRRLFDWADREGAADRSKL